jgi:metal-responsive CopG/Arc/MetJ family transcriptional regulator
MRRTNIYLTDELCQRLDRRAAAEAVSRAEIIRRLLDAGLNEEHDRLDRDIAALEHTFGAMADGALVFERHEDARMRHLDEIAHR